MAIQISPSGRAKTLTVLFGSAKSQPAQAARMGMILDQSFNEIYIFDATTLRFVYTNAGARLNMQYSLHELKRLTVVDVKPEYTVREYTRLLAPLRTGQKAQIVLETVHQRKGGTRYPVEARIQFCGAESAPSFICIINDITERRQTEEALFHEKELAEVTLESIGDAVIAVDTHGDIIFLNRMASRLTGWSKAKAQGLSLPTVFNVFNEETHKPVAIPLTKVSGTGDTARLPDNTLLMSPAGAQYAIEGSVTPIHARDGGGNGALLIFRDLTETRKLLRELSYQADHDALTDLVNRREFERKAEILLENARTTHEHHALLYLDLDQFKIVNDHCGHLAGDELLRQISSLLLSRMRRSDTLARLGGDEFGALLEDCPLEQAQVFAESLVKAVEEYRFSSSRGLLSVGVSVGVVPVTAHSFGLKSLLGAADTACYLAKEKGGNRVQLFQPDDVDVLSRKRAMDWISRVHGALDENRFCLFYQKIKPLSADHSTRAERYEVLLRMRDADGGIVLPLDFILAAERYNAITAIDRWVIKTAFESLCERYRGTYGYRAPVWAINLSGASIGDMQFLDFIMEQFERFAIPPEIICFELTETAAIANFTQAVRFVNGIKKKGCAFSLDDFGSGLSSFAYLKTLPVDVVKIDGAFIKGSADDPVDYAMVEAICRIARVMGVETVAEFVENDRVLNKLREIGVQYAQGAAIHEPEPLLPVNNTPVLSIQGRVRAAVSESTVTRDMKLAGDRSISTRNTPGPGPNIKNATR